MSAPNVTVTVVRRSSFPPQIAVNRTPIDSDYNYTMIVTNLNTDVVAEIIWSTNNFILQVGSNISNYNISVAAVNMCGNKTSDPITVFSKSIHTYIRTFTCMYVCTYVHIYIRM